MTHHINAWNDFAYTYIYIYCIYLYIYILIHQRFQYYHVFVIYWQGHGDMFSGWDASMNCDRRTQNALFLQLNFFRWRGSIVLFFSTKKNGGIKSFHKTNAPIEFSVGKLQPCFVVSTHLKLTAKAPESWWLEYEAVSWESKVPPPRPPHPPPKK